MGGSLFGAFLSGFGVLALDVASALLNGPKPQKAKDLKNKSFRSDAYGTDWSRFRGLVRAQGKDLWGTAIQTSIWKSVSGGFLGIGSVSVYFNKYSESRFVGFGEKIGGGAAIRIQRLWADGKLLFNGVASTGSISSSTVTVVGGGQQQGNQFALIDVGSGGTFTANAGDLIILGVDPAPYTVQTTVSVVGPATSVSVSIWPPLRQTFAGGSAVTLTQASISPYDLSSFDPSPHDGSHTAGGYPCPPGGVNFYLGSDTQGPDPTMVKHLGAGNVPGYRGKAAVMLHDLQLANYGDHRPAITAEICWDIAAPLYPFIGPIPSTDLTAGALFTDYMVLPFSGNQAIQWTNPFTQRLPYIWTFSQTGQDGTHDGTIYRVNTNTHLLEASVLVDRQGTFRLTAAGMVADNDGFLYFVQNNSVMTKMDGQTLNPVAMWPPPASWPGFPGNVHSIYCFDTVQFLFGQATLIKLAFVAGSIFDRNVMLRFGVADPMGVENVITGYTRNSDGTGRPIISTGIGATVTDGFAFLIDPPTYGITDDSNGNLWAMNGTDLIKINCQFLSWIDLSNPSQPKPMLMLPTLAQTVIDVTSLLGGGSSGQITYYPGDDTVVVFGVNKMGKVSASTASILTALTVTSTGTSNIKISQTYDPMGGALVNGTGGYARVDLATLQVLTTYDLTNWTPASFGQGPLYDPYSDSIWLNADNNGIFGGLNQALLDRGNGGGIGLDSLVSSLLLENGYASSEFDVTSLASKTFGGWECERETYLETLHKLMDHFRFDTRERDGKLECVLHGQASADTVLEDDLGALDDPSNYEARVIETTADERDLPRVVTYKYYDFLKNDQQATQEARRIVQPYASSLTGAKPNTSSQQQLDIISPLFDNALVVKQQADITLWEAWAGRKTYKFKLGPKSIRYDAGDVITLNYKSELLEVRIIEADFGSGFAREYTAVSQDRSVYTSAVTVASGGTGGGVIGTPPVATPTSYTISPASPLSEVSATDIHMVDVTATFNTGARTFYNNRDFTVSDPGAGNSQIYFVTVHDPTFLGEVPGTVSLTGYCTTTPSAAFVGIDGYIFMGTITITHDGVGVVVTSGGSGQTAQAIGFYVNGSGSTPPPSTGTVDLLTYMINSQRATKHLNGIAANSQASNNYSYVDTSTSSIAQIKSSAGWAADIQVYDANYIYQFITELDDVGYRLWSDDSSYKIYHTPIKMMPRFATAGVPIPDIVNSGTNPFDRYTACSLIDTINRGVVTCRNYFANINFDSDGAGGGNLGTISVLVHERYAGNSRERMYWGLNLGFVKWDNGVLVSGSPITGQYKITNWSVHNKLVAGGGVSLALTCSITYP